MIETGLNSWLAHLIRQLNTSFPESEINLVVDLSTTLDKRLVTGEFDLVDGGI